MQRKEERKKKEERNVKQTVLGSGKGDKVVVCWRWASVIG